MRIIDTITKIEYDSKELEEKVTYSILKLRDERIVKPSQFKLSDIDPEGIRNGISVYSDEEIERVKACNARILWGTIKYAEGYNSGYDAIFKSVIPNQSELIHQSKIFGFGQIDYANKFIQNKSIGNPSFEIFGRLKRVRGNPTYLKEEGTDEKTYLGGANQVITNLRGGLSKATAYWQFNISVLELLKTRTIFFDPEGIDNCHEYKKIYLVFGGIPIQAITKAEIKVIKENTK